jgi:hypothetical protein
MTASSTQFERLRKSRYQPEVKTAAVEQLWQETIHKKCSPETCSKYYAQCEAIVMTGAAIPCIPFEITPRLRADGM